MTDVDTFAGVSTQELVDRMVAAGEWPEPDLMDAIAARGADAVGPLLHVLDLDLKDAPDEAPIDHAVMILSAIRDARALPRLAVLYRAATDFEQQDLIMDAVHGIGVPALPFLLELMSDSTLTPLQRSMAGDKATEIVRLHDVPADDVAAALRDTLSPYLDQDPDEITSEDIDLLSFTVANLVDLRDPLARAMIDAAFAADLVDEFVVGSDEVEAAYSGAEEMPLNQPFDWLARYREHYEHKDEPEWEPDGEDPFDDEDLLADDLDVLNPFPPVMNPTFEPGPAIAPLLVAKLGRNDPCWCGSGKKYKKCHLDADLGRA